MIDRDNISNQLQSIIDDIESKDYNDKEEHIKKLSNLQNFIFESIDYTYEEMHECNFFSDELPV